MLYINIHLFLKAFLSYIWVGEWYIKGYGSLNPWPSGLENSNLPCFLVHKPTLGDRTRFFPPFFGVSLYCGPTAAESHDIFDQSRCPKVATLPGQLGRSLEHRHISWSVQQRFLWREEMAMAWPVTRWRGAERISSGYLENLWTYDKSS